MVTSIVNQIRQRQCQDPGFYAEEAVQARLSDLLTLTLIKSRGLDTAPYDDQLIMYCRVCLRYKCSPNSIVLAKAIITTPMKDGRFDPEGVPDGASVWITVTNPSSPLHGRPVLITKRPDGLFALTGGAGAGADARRHMVLTGGPKKTKRDKELETAIKRAEEYNEPIKAERAKYTKEARQEVRDAVKEMLNAMGIKEEDSKKLLAKRSEIQQHVSKVLGEEDDNSTASKKMTDVIMRQVAASNRKIRERVQRERQIRVLKAGLSEKLTSKPETEIEEESQLPEGRQVVGDADQVEVEERVMTGEGYDEDDTSIPDEGSSSLASSVDLGALNSFDVGKPIEVEMPKLEAMSDLSEPEKELAIARHFDAQVDRYFDEDRAEDEAIPSEIAEAEETLGIEDEDEKSPTVTLGESVEEMKIESPEKLQEAVAKVQSYWDKRRKVETLTRELKKVPLSQINPSTVQAIKEQEIQPASMEEIERQVETELDNSMTQNTALALYDAVSQHWNSDTSLADTLKSRRRDSSMKFHFNAGAASALSAMGKRVLDSRFDTARLIEDGNIEMASAVLAYEVAKRYDPASEKYATMVDELREYNAMNQKATEARALDRHGKLARQYAVIQEQKEGAELLDEVQISTLETDNLLAQRVNLGAAVGSLQASATFFDFLERYKNAERVPPITISVGSDEKAAESIVDKLKLRRNYDVDVSDPDNVVLNIGLSALRRYMREAPDVKKVQGKYEELKTSMEGVVELDDGNLVVEDYQVPGWYDTFTDGSGKEREYKWRVEQRNDIEWLREATRKTEENPEGVGGGLITRVTGAGKTNTALGFYAHKIAENPDYKALVVVPKGRAGQWHDEAKMFSDLKVELIPDGTKKAEVDEILANSEPGTIYMMGHREASRSHEVLTLMQSDPDLSDRAFQGMVIDEPQELQARGQSGNIGALGKRLMKLDFDHRVGLTATPARRNPTEAYDLIKWTQGSSKQLGSKAGFVRTFSGFGSGTNAQDSAINKLFFDTIQPYISGGRITDPNFKVSRKDVGVRRSDQQRQRQAEIERDSKEYIATRRQELISEARANPNHPLRRRQNWENTLSRRATEIARAEVVQQHDVNMDGGDFATNGKLQSLRQQLELERDKKHVIFVDSATQRRALTEMFNDMGYGRSQVKNIAGGTGSIPGASMAARAKAFRDDPNVKLVMIDKTSSSGYNLQSGDTLHVLGNPPDAATYLQSQGRVARMPRVGDVGIKTYRYEDSATEASKWNDIDTQLKVLRAAAPAMFI